MHNVIFTESKFKKMAHRLGREQRKAGVELPHQSVLQMLSRAIFDKSYEEVRATSFVPDTPVSLPVAPAVKESAPVYTILEYGQESILLRNDEYVTGNYPGTDLSVDGRIFFENAKAMAVVSGGTLVVERLPEILPEGFEVDDVINLGKKLGMLNPFDSIYKRIERGGVIKIDGRLTEYSLNGDYLTEVEIAFDEGEAPLDVCIWMPETVDKLCLHEYFFTLGILAQAKTSDAGKTWLVDNCVVEFVS